MKRTGPTKKQTQQLIVALEKHGKKNKEKVWLDIARRVKKPSRSRARVNLWKLERLSKKFGNKIFVVPGAVLSTGELKSAIEVGAFRFSEAAENKIKAHKGKAVSLNALMEGKYKTKNIVLVQ